MVFSEFQCVVSSWKKVPCFLSSLWLVPSKGDSIPLVRSPARWGVEAGPPPYSRAGRRSSRAASHQELGCRQDVAACSAPGACTVSVSTWRHRLRHRRSNGSTSREAQAVTGGRAQGLSEPRFDGVSRGPAVNQRGRRRRRRGPRRQMPTANQVAARRPQFC